MSDSISAWWKQVSRPMNFVNDIAAKVIQHGSVMIYAPEADIPWASDFIDLLVEKIRKRESVKAFERYECPEQNINAYILDKYVRTDRAVEYFPSMSLGDFVGKRRDIAMHNKIIWVYNINDLEKLEAWVTFIDDYNEAIERNSSNMITPASFILQVEQEEMLELATKKLACFNYNQVASTLSHVAFCSLEASMTTCKDYMVDYLVESTVQLCGKDVELCKCCITQWRDLLSDPVNTFIKIVKEKSHSDGRSFVADIDRNSLQRKVWQAQLRSVFPEIEKYRLNFIDKYETKLSQALQVKTYTKDGDRITDVKDIEINLLNTLAKVIQVSESSRNRMKKFYDARNSLAHMSTLEYEKINALLEYNAN